MRLIMMTLALMGVLYAAGCSTTPKQKITLEQPQHKEEDMIKDTVE